MFFWFSFLIGVGCLCLCGLLFGYLSIKKRQYFKKSKCVRFSGYSDDKNTLSPAVKENISTQEFPCVIIPKGRHFVDDRHIGENAAKVLKRLIDYGYEAYLVGGCIRDILLDKNPKDFDVVTNATPEDVRKLFRRSRVIGRRFKLVHVLFGRDNIEVATFRGGDHIDDDQFKTKQTKSGRIVRDNVYGSLEADVFRRDFTVNALYYNGKDGSIVDYCNGMEDLKNHTLCLIGDPDRRYREDPVRMLRAIRFAVKLNFNIAKETADPIRILANLLIDVPPARLYYEVLKLLQHGQGWETFSLLREFQLAPILFPLTEKTLNSTNHKYFHLFLNKVMANTDKRVNEQKPITPAFLFAAMLWGELCEISLQLMQAEAIPKYIAIKRAAIEVLSVQAAYTTIPKRICFMIKEIWFLQEQLEQYEKLEGSQNAEELISVLAHPRFRASYDFLVLREHAGEFLGGAGLWWTQQQETGKHR